MSKLTQIAVAGRGRLAADLLVAGCFAGEAPRTAGLPAPVAGRLSKAARGFKGKADRERHGDAAASGPARLVLHGLGPRETWEWADMSSWAARIAASARRLDAARVAVVPPVHALTEGESGAERLARALALAAYRYREFKAPEDERGGPDRAILIPPPEEAAAWRKGVARGETVAAAIGWARDLANTPPNIATPEWVAARARDLAAEQRMAIRTLGPKELAQHRMGGILAVAAGSSNPPRLVRLAWGERGPTIALVGKGVTFDTGGISIKPATHLDEMKWDKCGACTVLGVMRAAAALDLPVRLRAYLPLVENMPDGASYRPGDIVRCRNGKTVEILNTDAEGRMILADALAWACDEGPDALLEFSTLTGAAVVALGQGGGALYTPDDGLSEELNACAEVAGERLWRMPLWREFREQMQGDHADLKNTGGRWGGANTAAAFLSCFVEGVERWAHWDIAGPAYVGGNGKGPRGATGYGIASTIEWLRQQAGGRRR
ncbi:MAG: leucyl aminopeptidase family protein [Thermoanaerobaculia bacterium]